MHGPYSASVAIDRSTPVTFDEAELAAFAAPAHRFYQDATPALVDGAAKCAVFAAAALLDPDQDAEVEIHGFVAGKPTSCRLLSARRDSRGRFFTNLGCRFNERQFVGV